jgi:hydroxyacylglutathione hydrolase
MELVAVQARPGGWYTGAVGRLTEIAPGVLVATSSFALTTTTVVAGPGGGCLLIDAGVTVAEVAGLADELAERSLVPVVAWSTHPHWDHVLWSRELGDAPRYAAPAAVRIAETERAGMVGEMERSAPGHDLGLLGRLVSLDAPALPWDGPAARLIVHDAHAPGHGAVFLPDTGVLVAGDMCSDVEIPLLDTVADDAFGAYLTGLDRLAAVSGVRQVVPGHGHVGDAAEFRRRLAADSGYLDTLALRQPFGDPRLTEAWMRAAHEEHLRYVRRLGPRGAGSCRLDGLGHGRPARRAHDHGPFDLGRLRQLAGADRLHDERRRLDFPQRLPVGVAADQRVGERHLVLLGGDARIFGADVLQEQQPPARGQDPRDLAERRLLVRDAAQREGDHGGVERCVRERQLVAGAVEDLGVGREPGGALAQPPAHVRVGFDQRQARDGRRVVRQVQPRARADLDRGACGLGEQVVSLLPQPGSFGGSVEDVVHRGVGPRKQPIRHDGLPPRPWRGPPARAPARPRTI